MRRLVMPGDGLRVFYAQGGRPVQQLQEAATVIRSIVESPRLFTYNQVGGIAVRGTPEQLEAASWDTLPEPVQLANAFSTHAVRFSES